MKQGWEIKKLGEVASLITDGDWIESRHQSEDGIRLIQTGNIGCGVFKAKDDKPHYISEDTFKELGCTEIFPGDCLVSRLPDPVGRACIIPYMDCRMITAVDCTVIRFKEMLNPELFVYYSQSNTYQRDINNNTTGTTRKRISRKNLEQVSIPIPPLPEQEKIVSELDCLSRLIEKKRQQLKELDALAQSIFYEMFGNPVENERGWEVKKLGEVTNSVNYGTSFPANEGGAFTYLRMNNLTYNGYIDLNDTKKIDVPEKDLEKYIVRKGDVLFNRTNSKELVGKTALFNLDEEMVIAGYIIRVRVNKKFVQPIYVVRYMNTPFMKSYFRGLCKGAVNQANINSKELNAIPIPLPPLPLQQTFAQKVEAIEKQKELIKQSIIEAETLLASRMQYYFE